jgi:hypothetical protein
MAGFGPDLLIFELIRPQNPGCVIVWAWVTAPERDSGVIYKREREREREREKYTTKRRKNQGKSEKS